MLQSSITTAITPTELNFVPDGPPAILEVKVVNRSTQFATFQVELSAPGAEDNHSWYHLSPNIAHKQPPGDTSYFRVIITDSPIPQFTGTVNLTVRAFSVELGTAGESRGIVRLQIDETDRPPLELLLSPNYYSVQPLEQIEMPLQICNQQMATTEISVEVSGLSDSWISEVPNSVSLLSGESKELIVRIQPPHDAAAREHALSIQVKGDNNAAAIAYADVKVLPSGIVDFSCEPLSPKRSRFRWFQRSLYQLQFNNNSNIHQSLSVSVSGDGTAHSTIQIIPDAVTIAPYETTLGRLDIYPVRPWIGKRRQLPFVVEAIAHPSQQIVTPAHHSLSVEVTPRLTLWMQSALGLFFLYLLWWASWLNPSSPFFGHQAAVNLVQFNGTAEQLISAADDQLAIRWRASSFFRPFSNHQMGVIDRAEKSIRVARYRPVDNNWVAVGLENGEIHLNDLLSENRSSRSLIYEKDDRVLDLAFSNDARSLFSGHGSGWVLRWQLPYEQAPSDLIESNSSYSIPQNQTQMDFAVYSLALINENTLAAAGRYNKLQLWNWQSEQQWSLDYPYDGSKDDYITSLAIAAYRPHLLATADNQGHIIVWNLAGCLDTGDRCEIVDEWIVQSPVRSISLSDNGCYLASASAAGEATLWPLTQRGSRTVENREGDVVTKSTQGLNSIDIKLARGQLFVASGGEDSRVRLKRLSEKRLRSSSGPRCDAF